MDLLKLIQQLQDCPEESPLYPTLLILLAIALPPAFALLFSLNWYVLLIDIIPLAFLVNWALQRYGLIGMPKAPNKHLGILVAVRAETREQAQQVESDFVGNLQRFLPDHVGPQQLSVLRLPWGILRRFLARGSTEEMIRLMRKTRSTFGIFGHCKVRRQSGEEYFCLDLSGVVFHANVPQETKNILGKEFATLFPKTAKFKRDDELLGFEIISSNTALVCEYIIGIAALISGSPGFCIKMLEDLMGKLNSSDVDQSEDLIEKLRPRAVQGLIIARYYTARLLYRQYRKDLDPRTLTLIEQQVDLILSHGYHYNALLLQGILRFHRGDIAGAKAAISACRGEKDPAWRYSDSFLSAWEGKLLTAHRKYENVFKLKASEQTLEEVCEFIAHEIERKPDRRYLLFFLGQIYLRARKDGATGCAYLTQFLQSCQDAVYIDLRIIAQEALQCEVLAGGKSEAASTSKGAELS